MVLTEDVDGDLEVLTGGEGFKAGKWLSGSLYEDSYDALRIEFPEDSDDEAGNVLMFLLGAKGGLQVRTDLHKSHSVFFDRRES